MRPANRVKFMSQGFLMKKVKISQKTFNFLATAAGPCSIGGAALSPSSMIGDNRSSHNPVHHNNVHVDTIVINKYGSVAIAECC